MRILGQAPRVGDYAAIGQSFVHSEGHFRAMRKDDAITIDGEVTHRLGVRAHNPQRPNYYRDVYDFDSGQPGSFPAITLEHAGVAKRFDIVSEPRVQRVRARVRVRPGGLLELDGSPVWEPIR